MDIWLLYVAIIWLICCYLHNSCDSLPSDMDRAQSLGRNLESQVLLSVSWAIILELGPCLHHDCIISNQWWSSWTSPSIPLKYIQVGFKLLILTLLCQVWPSKAWWIVLASPHDFGSHARRSPLLHPLNEGHGFVLAVTGPGWWNATRQTPRPKLPQSFGVSSKALALKSWRTRPGRSEGHSNQCGKAVENRKPQRTNKNSALGLHWLIYSLWSLRSLLD